MTTAPRKGVSMDEWDEYGTYEMEDDLYQYNQDEADDYRYEMEDWDMDSFDSFEDHLD